MRPQSLEKGPESGFRRLKDATDRGALRSLGGQPPMAVYDDRLTSLRPNRQVNCGVACIIKSALTKSFSETGSLGFPTQVGLAVAAEDFIKKPKMVCHLAGGAQI